MVGKGQRRREKNYRAAHGGESRLPPPPKAKELDAIPSKLRRLMELQEGKGQNGLTFMPLPKQTRKTEGGNDVTNRSKKGAPARGNEKNHKDELKDSVSELEQEKNNGVDEDKKKKKKKRKRDGNHLFQNLDLEDGQLTRKKRKKDYLEARKKKHKKPKTDNIRDFPGCEDIKFGEVVDAPPKLTLPKAFKLSQKASVERLRLQAVESYRKRRGWESRPGINIPSTTEAS